MYAREAGVKLKFRGMKKFVQYLLGTYTSVSVPFKKGIVKSAY